MIPTGNNVWLALIAVIAYILGSFSTAYFVTRGMTGKDIRFEGSRNVGGMNAYSIIKGNRSGKLATAGLAIIQATDMGKGILAIYIARWLGFLGYNPAIALILASAFVILGHNYIFYFRFKQGGRGLATFMGVLLGLNEPSLPIWMGTVILSIVIAQCITGGKTNWKSFTSFFSVLGKQVAGRLAGMGIALVPLYFFDPRLLFPVLAATILILIKHAGSIKALVRGTENPPK